MEPNDVNGLIRNEPRPHPMTHGQIMTADFMISGNLQAAYQHLKEMFEPKVHAESGPIKQMTNAELNRQNHKPQEDFVDSLDPTITG